MLNLDFSDEELETLKFYREKAYNSINQLLTSNCETDVAYLIQNEDFDFSFKSEEVERNIKIIKILYEMMQKNKCKSKRKEGWACIRVSNVLEIEVLKNEPFIDKFLLATSNMSKAEKEYNSFQNRPVLMYMCGTEGITYLEIGKILSGFAKDEILIAPFTKITEITPGENIITEQAENNILKTYNVKLEKQQIESLTEEEREGLYRYIIENANYINQKLYECVDIEKENSNTCEKIRKLEQLLSKYEQHASQREEAKDYPVLQRAADNEDIERIENELEDLKNKNICMFNTRRNNINIITNWKKNVAVYLMAECKEIELKYVAISDVIDEEEKVKIEQYKKEAIEKSNMEEEEKYEKTLNEAEKTLNENLNLLKKLKNDTESLISKEQKFAKIAGNLGTNYCALTNAFDIKEKVNEIEKLFNKLKDKVDSVTLEEDTSLKSKKIEGIVTLNTQVSTLINYLYQPKIAAKTSNISRFDEISIIEENELKRGIATKIRELRGEAELRKLKDDLELIEDKSRFSRFIGKFTGKNKLDEFMIEQIGYRKDSIKRTLSHRMSLAQSYSVHELVAEIEMFVDDNNDDELVENYKIDLESLECELKRNFVILDSKVQNIIDEKEGRLLLSTGKKLSKMESIEVETRMFLHKYGYDVEIKEDEPEYKNTILSELKKVIEYIKNSQVLKEN